MYLSRTTAKPGQLKQQLRESNFQVQQDVALSLRKCALNSVDQQSVRLARIRNSSCHQQYPYTHLVLLNHLPEQLQPYAKGHTLRCSLQQ